VYDVIVVGLGPGGLSFLKSLEGAGLKVLAVEKEKFPDCTFALSMEDFSIPVDKTTQKTVPVHR